jgi:hypothetical protein
MDLSYLKDKKVKFHLRQNECSFLLSLLGFVTSEEVEGLFESVEDKKIIVGIGLKIAKQYDESLRSPGLALVGVDKEKEASLD